MLSPGIAGVMYRKRGANGIISARHPGIDDIHSISLHRLLPVLPLGSSSALTCLMMDHKEEPVRENISYPATSLAVFGVCVGGDYYGICTSRGMGRNCDGKDGGAYSGIGMTILSRMGMGGEICTGRGGRYGGKRMSFLV